MIWRKPEESRYSSYTDFLPSCVTVLNLVWTLTLSRMLENLIAGSLRELNYSEMFHKVFRMLLSYE